MFKLNISEVHCAIISAGYAVHQINRIYDTMEKQYTWGEFEVLRQVSDTFTIEFYDGGMITSSIENHRLMWTYVDPHTGLPTTYRSLLPSDMNPEHAYPTANAIRLAFDRAAKLCD